MNIISEGDDAYEMFFIQTGDCIVNIRDHNLRQATAVRLLTEGSIFGEICMRLLWAGVALWQGEMGGGYRI